jgi:hypothetical protein
MNVKTRNGISWGSWHTGDGSACPQGCGPPRHSVETAVRLNMAENERRRAALRAAHDRWLGKSVREERGVAVRES